MSAFQLTDHLYTQRHKKSWRATTRGVFLPFRISLYIYGCEWLPRKFIVCFVQFVSAVFDGPGGVLGKSSYPREGAFVHFDESETWTHNSDKGNISIILFK